MKTLTKPGGTRQILAGILLFAATFLRADMPLPPIGDYTFTLTADHADST